MRTIIIIAASIGATLCFTLPSLTRKSAAEPSRIPARIIAAPKEDMDTKIVVPAEDPDLSSWRRALSLVDDLIRECDETPYGPSIESTLGRLKEIRPVNDALRAKLALIAPLAIKVKIAAEYHTFTMENLKANESAYARERFIEAGKKAAEESARARSELVRIQLALSEWKP